MDFSEFKRRLGAEPASHDPELLRARESSPEFAQEAEAAAAFEQKLSRALDLPVPEGLQEELNAIASAPVRPQRWKPLAIAASVLLAVGAAGLGYKMNRSWDSVDEYLQAHYEYDGARLVALAAGQSADNVESILSEFDFEASAGISDMIGYIKYCPTPDGEGIHMVLNTRQGPVTVILMPETTVSDSESTRVHGLYAHLVSLSRGSAAIIGADNEMVSELGPMLRSSIVPSTGKA
jgi:hypothetical protein